jgi:hypothetical protein
MPDTLIHRKQVLTGGGSNAADGIDGNDLYGGELVIVHTAEKLLYIYQVNATSGQAESVPSIICPDVNPGDKRLELLAMLNQSILLPDTSNAYNLVLQSGEELTADRILSIVLGNASRTLTVSGDATLLGSNTGDETESSIKSKLGITTLSGSNTGDQDLSDYAPKSYVDSAVVGLLDDRGNYDASGDVFPSSGGSGDAGAILKGDLWIISVAGTLGGTSVAIGDQIRALCDTPGQTSSNWAIMEGHIGYVPANDSAVLHKSTSGEIAAMPEKTTLDDADVFIIEDSDDEKKKKKVSASTVIASNLVVSNGILFIKEA